MENTGFIIIIIVLGVLFVGCLAGVICLAVMRPSSSSEDKLSIRFDKYEAETSFIAVDASTFIQAIFTGNYHYSGRTKEYVFGPHKWFKVSYNRTDQLYSRDFMTDVEGGDTTCFHYGSHDECYVLTSDEDMTYEIERPFYYIGEDNCTYPKLFQGDQLKNRKLDKCKMYGFSAGLITDVRYVESETGYPIMEQIDFLKPRDSSTTGSYIYLKFYESFAEGKPSDESGLKPFPYVTVYDFRDGKGDVGDGPSYEFKKEVGKTQIAKGSQRMKERTGLVELLEAFSEKDNNSEKTSQYSQAMRRERAIRKYLHLPLRSIQSLPTSSSKQISPIRDVRDIPASFDAREHWSNCSSVIGTITDQGICGSCWAMATSGVLADRRCIFNNDDKQQLSPQFLVYCSNLNFGCDGGGEPLFAWDYMSNVGTVPESCVPFVGKDGACPTRCRDGTLINKDVLVPAGKVTVTPWGNSSRERVQAIQTEIMSNGPVAASYLVFSDFFDFFGEHPKGIYHRSVNSTFEGGHVVRVIGWGTEGGVDYWLFANSWGESQGDGGYFKIRRGNNECNFEEEISATLFV